ncbi:MAG: cation diffusion facilitator family transporter [Chloroflexi bacterium]|nr:cation diffusion facilitator family transporter [Chloroflexota bacterium]
MAVHEHPLNERTQAVSRVLWQILVLNVLVAAGKIAVGLLTGTVSIIADGLHSTIDSASNIIALFAQRIAARPPDETHPYGHQRFETLASLGIGGMLLLAGWEVLKVAIERLRSGEVPEVGEVQFVVLLMTLVVNLWVVLYERNKSQKLNSELLKADAAHTTSDVWVTISVIAGLIGVKLGLGWMDAAVSLLIVGVIGYTAWGILRRTGGILVDEAPLSPEKLAEIAELTPGVNKVIRARSRGTEDAVLVDLDVQMDSSISTEYASNITERIRERLAGRFPHITEVQVHVIPDHSHQLDYITAARAAADALGLGVHEISGVVTPQGKVLEMHVEVPPAVTLREAHRQIDLLESRLRGRPEIVDVVTHIEPAEFASAMPAVSPDATKLHVDALTNLRHQFPQGDWHDSNIRRDRAGYALTLHCHLPGDISIEMAHQIAEEAELFLRMQFPQLHRVTIHTEPEDDNSKGDGGL